MRGLIIGAAALLCCGGATAKQDNSQCAVAVDTYNSTISDVSSQLRRYSACLNDSQGKDDCSSEFSRLRRTQSDFESAVSAIQSYCE